MKKKMFWLQINGDRKGPYELDELRQKWACGELHLGTPYWCEGMKDWGLLRDLADLFASKQRRDEQPPPFSSRQFSSDVFESGSDSRLMRLSRMLMGAFCALSIVTFFLPAVSVTVPIFGAVETSMFELFSPTSDSSGNGKMGKHDLAEALKPNSDLGKHTGSPGFIVCVVAFLGLCFHYLLTLIWMVHRLAISNVHGLLERLWVVMGCQYPVLLMIGGKLFLHSVTSETITKSNDPFSALGVAFLNNIQIVPGPVMWGLLGLGILSLIVSWLISPTPSLATDGQ